MGEEYSLMAIAFLIGVVIGLLILILMQLAKR